MTAPSRRGSAPSSDSSPSPEVLPRPEYDSFSVLDQLDSLALLTAPDHCEPAGLFDRGEQFVVLAEAEVVQVGLEGQRHALELDHDLAAGPCREVRGVRGDAVGEVEQRVRVRREPPPLLQAQRWTNIASPTKRRARGAQRA